MKVNTCANRVLGVGFLAAQLFLLSPAHAQAAEWVDLFDGKSLDGWAKTKGDAVFEVKDGAIVGGGAAKTTFLFSDKEYGDFELEFEVKIHDLKINSGVQIRTKRFPSEKDVKTLKGPQVDLGKSPGRSGYIFCQGGGRWITPKEKLVGHSHMKNGEWNKVRVVAKGPRIQTWINGTQVNDLASEEDHKLFPSGVIGLQIHGVKDYDGNPRFVSWRNIRIREG